MHSPLNRNSAINQDVPLSRSGRGVSIAGETGGGIGRIRARTFLIPIRHFCAGKEPIPGKVGHGERRCPRWPLLGYSSHKSRRCRKAGHGNHCRIGRAATGSKSALSLGGVPWHPRQVTDMLVLLLLYSPSQLGEGSIHAISLRVPCWCDTMPGETLNN
jgi:hypothetical protein